MSIHFCPNLISDSPLADGAACTPGFVSGFGFGVGFCGNVGGFMICLCCLVGGSGAISMVGGSISSIVTCEIVSFSAPLAEMGSLVGPGISCSNWLNLINNRLSLLERSEDSVLIWRRSSVKVLKDVWIRKSYPHPGHDNGFPETSLLQLGHCIGSPA